MDRLGALHRMPPGPPVTSPIPDRVPGCPSPTIAPPDPRSRGCSGWPSRPSVARSGRARSGWPKGSPRPSPGAGTCWSRPAPAPASRWPTWCPPCCTTSGWSWPPRPWPSSTSWSSVTSPGWWRRSNDQPGLDTSYAVLKGRSNYACLHRIREGVPDDQGVLVDVPSGSMGAEVLGAAHLGRGSRPRPAAAASATTRRATPTGSGARCRVNAPRVPGRDASARSAPSASWSWPASRPMRSHLIVTNHSLLAIDAIEGVPMIPDYSSVVIDEAHELTARVTQAATDELTVSDVERAARRSQRSWSRAPRPTTSTTPAGALAAAIGECAPGRIDRSPSSSATRWSWCATPRAPACRPTPRSPTPRARTPARTQARGHGPGGVRRPPSGWPPTPRPTCCGSPRAASGCRPGCAWPRCRCGARCATSCSPTRPSSSPPRR